MSKQEDDKIKTELDEQCIKEIQELVNGNYTHAQPYVANVIARVKMAIQDRESKL
jgi:hypothetical protein